MLRRYKLAIMGTTGTKLAKKKPTTTGSKKTARPDIRKGTNSPRGDLAPERIAAHSQRAGRGLSRCGVRAAPPLAVGTAGGHDFVGAVYRRAREHRYPGTLSALSHACRHGEGEAT